MENKITEKKMMKKKILLSGKNISKSFQNTGHAEKILEHLDIDIYEGDFTIIMGSSGAGKSTLLYALSGMEQITEGIIEYKNQIISRYSEKEMAALRAEEFGFVFQQTYLVDHLTLLENVLVPGLLCKTRSKQETVMKVQTLLEEMHVENAADRMPSQTSGGEAQRAAIARAVINSPGVLFADEPTGALNKKNSEQVMDLFSKLNQKGQSILMVTHDMRAALRGNRIIYLEDGKIVDELRLSAYQKDAAKDRETKLYEWLSALEW